MWFPTSRRVQEHDLIATSLMSAGPRQLVWLLTVISAGGLGFDVAAQVPGSSDMSVAQPGTGSDRGSVQPLPFFYDLYTFRAEGGRTTVVAAFAVEAGNLETESVGANKRYRFSVTLELADTALRSITNRHDTVFVDLPRRLRDDHLIYTEIEVEARPSRDIKQRVIMIDATTPGIGQLYWKYFPIPDYSGSALMLSDVALGQPDEQSGWTRGGATLALLPTSQFPSSAFDVYYEIYNLPVGHPYTTEIMIERFAGMFEETVEEREPVRLRFAGQSAAADGTLPELRRVETSLSKGSYRITVTVEDLSTGRTASRSRTFEVTASGRGATMVPALPVTPRKR